MVFGVMLSLAAVAAGRALAQEGVVAATGAGPAGQRISLDLKGVDILDVLKLLSQKSGINFIAGRNVTGKVTIFANDVDVWEAFEIIIGANDLAYERQGDLVTVMMARDYELLFGQKFQERTKSLTRTLQYAKVTQAATVLNQLKSSIGRVVADEGSNTLVVTDVPSRLAEMEELLKELDRPSLTRIYNLNYAEAEKLKEKVQELLTPVGTFSFDARTNKAVITDLPEVMEKVDQVISAFDVPDGQVLIEAKIVKVELTDTMNAGIDWQQIFGADLSARTNLRVLSDIIAPGTATGGALKFFTFPDDKTKIVLEALNKITKTDTLSNPRIMVSNNQEAKILVGTKEAVVTVTTTVPATGSTVSAPEIQYVDVGTKLFVTPSIKRDGHIQIKIRPEVSTSTTIEFQTNRIPIVTSTEAETNVLVKSGTTLIIGGLIESKDDTTKNRVPVLSDIPLLGLPFRSTSGTKKKTELVVFLTPQIVMPDGATFVPPKTYERIADKDLPEVILREPVPAGYREIVRSRLQQQLTSKFRSLGLGGGSVVVSFVLSHDGHIVGEPKTDSPQGEAFQAAAVSALMDAQPFSQFPEGSPAKEVRFRLAVEYAP